MVENNPYENDSKESQIPSFVNKNDDVDMSVFSLDEEDYEEEDEERRRPSKINFAYIGMIVCLVIAIVCLILALVQSKKYKTLNSEFVSYKTTAEATEKKLTDEKSDLLVENEKLKIDLEEAKKNASSNPATPGSDVKTTPVDISNVTAGKYKVIISMKVRTCTKADNDACPVVDIDTLPQSLKENVYSSGSIVEDTIITITSVSKDGDKTWGQIGTNQWVCLVDGNTPYVSKVE